MASINGWVFLIIGAVVAGWSLWLGNLPFFVIVGGIFAIYGVGKIIVKNVTKPSNLNSAQASQNHSHHPSNLRAQTAQNTMHSAHNHQLHAQHQDNQQNTAHTHQHQTYNPAQQSVAYKVCPNCKKQFHATYRFCPYCGWGI